MRYLGLVDIFVLPFNGILTGILAIRGDVYCSNPDLIYISGALALGLYCSVSMVSVLLAINRCVEMIYPRLNEVIFSPNMLTCWFIIASLYGVYFTMFTVPIKFCGIYLSWFFSPYAGYTDKDAELYHNVMHSINNTIESSSLVGMYTIFCIVLVFRSVSSKGTMSSHSIAKRKSQIRSFIQVFLISIVNVVACSVGFFT
jgi:hypothetical protein